MLKLDASPWKPAPTFRQPVSIPEALDDLVFWSAIVIQRGPLDIEIRLPIDQLNRVVAEIENRLGSGNSLRLAQLQSPDRIFRYNGIKFLPAEPVAVDPGEFAECFALSG